MSVVETPEVRAEKYDAKQLAALKAKGHTFPGGTSYPIDDQEDLDNAIHAVGRGGAEHDDIRKYIMRRAKEMGCSDMIPDNWNADGSLRSVRPKRERHRAVPLTPEVRFFAPTQVEVRSAATADSHEVRISGAAIMYGAQYRVVDVFGEFRETIHRGAVSNLIERGVDCRLLLNHAGLPMARTSSGTMKLIDTPEALRFEAVLDSRQQLANDFAIAIERGDLSQMSIGMIVSRDKWGSDESGAETRDIFQLGDLMDVSGVTYPCSETTHIEVAQRMAFAMPVESRARLRNMEAELRAGKTLSSSNQGLLVQALKALHDLAGAGGIDAGNLDGDMPEDAHTDMAEASEPGVSSSDDGSMGGDELGAYLGSPGYDDGSGTRQVDPGTDPITSSRNKTAIALRLQLEQRKRKH